MRRLLVAMAALGAVLLLASCGSEGTDPAAGATVPVRMTDNAFSPARLQVPAGTPVVFDNVAFNPHNAVAIDGSWSTEDTFGSLTMLNGDATRLAVDEPGIYRYYCTFHGTDDGLNGMVGVLVVGDFSDEEVAAALGEDDAPSVPTEPSGVVRRVPEDHPTIQNAVDAAEAGDLVLVGPGVYSEAVEVTTPYITIRGLDRNDVILDGDVSGQGLEVGQLGNGIVAFADGVVMENMTARNYSLNGFFWSGVTGYRGSYLTAYNNGDYGIYAFDSVDGVFDHSYGSGSPDAGFYVGQCDPCRAILNDVVAEHNGLGYSGTNSSGVYIVNSTWRFNKAGIVPNTLDSELLPPVEDNVIVGNLIHDNNNVDAPAKRAQYVALGNGIVLLGGNNSLIAGNVILDHDLHGVVVAPSPDRNFWWAGGNQVRSNVVDGSGRGDLALVGPSANGNCFDGNLAGSTVPPGLDRFYPCDGGFRLPLGSETGSTMQLVGRFAHAEGGFEAGDYRDQPVPPDQPNMPAPESAPALPAVDVFDNYTEVNIRDLTSIPLPREAFAIAEARGLELPVPTSDFAPPSFFQWLFSAYGYLLPVVLLAAWVTLSFVDLGRRDDLSQGARAGWSAAVLLVPFVGPAAYLYFGRARIDGFTRNVVVLGGVGAYIVILAVAAFMGGVV